MKNKFLKEGMFNKLLGFTLVLTLAIMLFPSMSMAVKAEESPIKVGDCDLLIPSGVILTDDDKNQTVAEITSDTTTLSEGWYAVNSDVTISCRMCLSGNVNLILCDGKTLTACKGIELESDSSLTIWGQNGQTGTLKTTGYYGYPDLESESDLEMPYPEMPYPEMPYPAIGSSGCINSSITVNGGKVDAEGTDTEGRYAEGISLSYGDFIVNGGEVTVTSGTAALFMIEGDINIKAGKVSVSSEDNDGTYANDIYVSGGTFETTSSRNRNGICATNVFISGGSVTTTGHQYALGVSDSVEITGGTLTALATGYMLGNFKSIKISDDLKVMAGSSETDSKIITDGDYSALTYSVNDENKYYKYLKIWPKLTLSASEFEFTEPTDTDGSPIVTAKEDGIGTITVYYSKDNGITWTTEVPSKEGTYLVAVKTEAGTEYKKSGNYITDSDWTFSIGHSLTKVDAVSATTTSTGNREYYTCSACGKLFLDAAGTNETTLADVTIPKLKTAGSVKLSKTVFTYNGKVQKPSVTAKDSDGKTISSSCYDVTYAKGRVNPGVYKVIVTFKGTYTGQKTITFKINKATNPMKLKKISTILKYASLQKKAAAVTVTFSKKAQGKVTYTLSKNAEKAGIKVSSKGKITVPKKCKKGTYKIAVKAVGNSKYKTVGKTFTVKVK